MTLFNLLAEAVTDAASNAPQKANNGWIIWVIFGVLILVMIVPSFLRNKKEKKAYEEKMANLVVGAKVRTIGLIVGEIISMTDQTVTLKTGDAENFSFVTVEKRAIYEIIPDDAFADSEEVYSDASQEEVKEDITEAAETTETAENETTTETATGTTEEKSE